MTATDPHGRTPEEIEREVSQERGRLKKTAEELQERISIGALVDDMLERTRRGGAEGGEFFRNLGRSVRENPVPVALMGAGLAWMMSGGQERSADPRRGWERMRGYFSSDEEEWYHGEDGEGLGERLSERAREARERAGEAGESTLEGISGTAEGVREGGRSAAARVSGAARRARERTGSAAHRASGTADYASGRARAAAAQARYRARATGASLAETGEEAYWQTREYGRRASDSAYRFAEEQPLVVGALAVALGAALGSLLPNTRAEDRLMGEPAERLRGQAGEALRHESERARRVAEAALEEGRRAAEEALDEASDEASTVAERAEARAREAGERVQGAAEREAERQDLGGTVRSEE